MQNKNDQATEVRIIGGGEGPTTVEITGVYKKHKENGEDRIQKFANQLVAEPHTLEEVEAYIIQKYKAQCVNDQEEKFQDTFKSIKAALIFKERPELMTTEAPSSEIDWDVESERTHYIGQLEKRNEEAAQVPHHVFPISVKKYYIPFYRSDEKIGGIDVDMEMNYGLLGVSFHIQSKEKDKIKEIVKDIYRYYGVKEQDKIDRTERFMTLFGVMERKE